MASNEKDFFKPRRWAKEHPDGGRVDRSGIEWFVTDPYPTWYRRDGLDRLIVGNPIWTISVRQEAIDTILGWAAAGINEYSTDEGKSIKEVYDALKTLGVTQEEIDG